MLLELIPNISLSRYGSKTYFPYFLVSDGKPSRAELPVGNLKPAYLTQNGNTAMQPKCPAARAVAGSVARVLTGPCVPTCATGSTPLLHSVDIKMSGLWDGT